MKERPILFSAPMVHAILAGAKSQTRRIVKPPKCATVHGRVSYPDKHFSDPSFRKHGPLDYLHWAYGGGDHGSDVLFARVMCPYGPPELEIDDGGEGADRLWVRETFAAPWGKDYKLPGNDEPAIFYRADGPAQPSDGAWSSPLFMPRWASRITLEITEVRVERLQSISEEDAKAEGVVPLQMDNGSYLPRYEGLWNAINDVRGKRWIDNPWIWALSFKRVKP